MQLKDIIWFFTKNRVGFLGTIDGGRPRVRPFHFQLEHDEKLYFCTSNAKDVYRQLVANPWIEFCVMSPEYTTMRVSGAVRFTKDLEIKRRILKFSDIVRPIFVVPENPKFEVFYLEHGTVKIVEFNGEPPRYVNF